MANMWITQMQASMPGVLSSVGAAAVSFLRLLILLGAAYVAARFLKTGLHHLEAILIRAGEPGEAVPGSTRKRVVTLVGLIRTLGLVTLWAMVIVIGLAQLGLDVTPILAGAGIVGLAVGFGAQNLVRDVISGFFVVLENQVRVGDVAVVNGTGGLVEAISFRTIVMRDLAGVVHVFPHGTVTTLANMTKEWSGYVLDVDVAYQEDTDRVVAVMRRVAEELRTDPQLGAEILAPIEIFGVDAFGESAITIKARLKTQPLRQWDVGREYRRRLKKAFDAEGIEIPFPHRSISMSGAGTPLAVVITEGVPAGTGRPSRPSGPERATPGSG